MDLKFFIFLLSFIINSKVILAEQLKCNYRIFDKQYVCELSIINKEGRNNYGNIEGAHAFGNSDKDVKRVHSINETITKNIPEIICKTFTNVRQIELMLLHIEAIHDYSFKGCESVSYLNLQENDIKDINEDAFVANTELRELSLHHNQLTTLPENVFKSQEYLETLWLDSNQISDLPANIFTPLRTLRRLELHKNQISNLKVEWFQNLRDLEILSLFSNSIEELPQGVFSSLKRLTYLIIARNKLKVISSDAISLHPSLEEIYLQNNQIEAIDEMFIDNTGVKIIDLSNNKCAFMEFEIDPLKRDEWQKQLKTCFDNYKKLA